MYLYRVKRILCLSWLCVVNTTEGNVSFGRTFACPKPQKMQAGTAASKKRGCVVNTGGKFAATGMADPEKPGEYLYFSVVGVIHGSSRRTRKNRR